jgi:hypothetical protein
MDYFQGVVIEYLRANRSVFVNTECLIQLDEGNKQLKGRHWYCDAMAVNFKERAVYLCEITYSATMQSLLGRLHAWQDNWSELTAAVLRDAGIPEDWKVQPWLFIPKNHHAVFVKKYATWKPKPGVTWEMPAPRVTYLESVAPWVYKTTWDRKLDAIAGDA